MVKWCGVQLGKGVSFLMPFVMHSAGHFLTTQQFCFGLQKLVVSREIPLIIILLSRHIFLEEVTMGEGMWSKLRMNTSGSIRAAQN